MWYYFFDIKIWNQIEEKEEKEKGFVRAETVSLAVSELAEYYGDQNIIELRIKTIENGDAPLTFEQITNTIKAEKGVK